MTWRYQIMRHKYETPGINGEYSFQIHEVYLDDNGEVDTWTEDGMEPFGESPEELRECYDMMKEAFDMPVLDENGDEISPIV